ncbi:MAG: hypothetical protein C7B45_06145 [Sulfobacillus acidophilus]|uniref:Glycosyltransferase RgtA/B/C/D-like domain-containing protein n=1 Tax=Sulfobacillus acidophilus TaxID=53633 RepID=A0A2T2WK77_9FIRM|nr:MAG: hypothetical protein C7B45_06145 [Sulfobacillus acidophilus]
MTMALPVPLMVLTMAQVVVGGSIVAAVLPTAMFPRLSIEDQDQWLVRLGFMMTWLMLAGYLLAALHIFSGVALLFLMAITAWLLHRRAHNRYVLTGGQHVAASLFDRLSQSLDDRAREGRDWKRWLSWVPRRPWDYLWAVLVLLVLALAAWMRLGPNWQHAALFSSDADETLQWVKGIDASSLFPTGLYPMGYYLVMAALQTLTHANAVVFVKFFSALVGTLLTASVMWSTYRFAGRAVPALAAGLVYGIMPHLLPYDGVRQLAAEGQEFGDLWVLPLAWLIFQSWVTRRRGYVLAGVAMLTAVALTHPVALINAVLAAIAATLAGWVVAGVAGPILKDYLWMVPLAALVSVLPLAIGFALGIPLLSTGVSFLHASGVGGPPPIGLMAWVALAGIFALFVTKLLWYDELWEMGVPLIALLLLMFAEAIMQLPRVGVDSAVLMARGGALLALVETFCVGLGVAGVQEAVERLGVFRTGAAAGSLVAVLASAVVLLRHMPPRPFVGYSMTSDTFVAEMVRIETSFPRFSWDVVANGAYALVLNDGYQYEPSFWLSHMSYADRWPIVHGLSPKAYPISQRYIFFFVPHHLALSREVPGRVALLAQDRAQDRLVTLWIREWTRRHGPMPVYFENPALTIYWIVNPKNPLV